MGRATPEPCDSDEIHDPHRWEDGNYLYRCPGIAEYVYYHVPHDRDYSYYDDEDWDDEY